MAREKLGLSDCTKEILGDEITYSFYRVNNTCVEWVIKDGEKTGTLNLYQSNKLLDSTPCAKASFIKMINK
jgi:hypothetical protein